jgi:hypothetical protein
LKSAANRFKDRNITPIPANVQRFCHQISADEVFGTQRGRYVSHCAVGQETAFFCQNDAKLGEQKPAFFFRQLDARRPPCPVLSPNNVPEGLSTPNVGIRWVALVEYNRKTFGSNRIEFRLLDIVSADLPIGDICLVRQVFQHLSNQEIACTLPKLQKYRHVYVTEGHPIVRDGKINPDKPTGEGFRFDWTRGHGRGVELNQSPYNLDVEEVCPVATPAPVHEIIVT